MCTSGIFGGAAKPSSPAPAPVVAPPPPQMATESTKSPVDKDRLRKLQQGFASTVKTQQKPLLATTNATGKTTTGA